jgi:Type VI secretion system, TssN
MIRQPEQSFSFLNFARVLFQNRRRAGMYGLIFIFVSFNLGLFFSTNMHSPDHEKIVNAVQLVCFLIMGIINVWYFYKRNFLAELFFSGAKLAFILLLFILIAFVLFIYYYDSGNDGLIMAFASSSAFLFPFIVDEGWKEYMAIPARTYPVWYLPITDADYTISFSATGTIQIQLKIYRKEKDNSYNLFPVTAPGKVKLGKIFGRFIAEQNIPDTIIEIKDKNSQTFGWQFYEEKWFGFYNMYLNPAKSLIENNIKPDAKIIVVRVNEPASV